MANPLSREGTYHVVFKLYYELNNLDNAVDAAPSTIGQYQRWKYGYPRWCKIVTEVSSIYFQEDLYMFGNMLGQLGTIKQ